MFNYNLNDPQEEMNCCGCLLNPDSKLGNIRYVLTVRECDTGICFLMADVKLCQDGYRGR